MSRNHDPWKEPPGRRIAGLAFLHRAQPGMPREFLMLKRATDGRWILPGGMADAAETAVSACMRHTLEAVGMTVSPFRVLTVDHVSANPRDGSAEGLNVVFDCGPATSRQITQHMRVSEYFADHRWVDIERVRDIACGYEQRRLIAVDRAVRTGSTHYLNDGRPATALAA
ncbi:NUDIX domain-containing protein [Streptomyces decoyicus]|uniref:NUDIX domain-containing protein n=1 Tax=Streptomyces decoyicus TaxID=249567 RepID=UPI003868990D|nr:NUDIX domain-containing protein [Streptomyces decoyicus]